MSTYNEIMEEFLDDLVNNRASTSFNLADAEDWINRRYRKTSGGQWSRGEVSAMLQRYCHSQRNLASTRGGVFQPSFVIDVNKRGGPNAVWTVHQSTDDAVVSHLRTVDDIFDIALTRTVERVDPTMAKDPAVMAQFAPMKTAMQANLQVVAAMARALKP